MKYGLRFFLARCLPLCAAASMLPGCLLPYAAPPLRAVVGTGPVGVLEDPIPSRPAVVGMDLRGTVDLLQLLNRPRYFDVGPGYGMLLTVEQGEPRIVHGPHLSTGVFLFNGMTQGGMVRCGVNLSGSLLTDNITPTFGYGGRLETYVELAHRVAGEPVSGSSSSGALMGVAYGETGIGAYLAGEYQSLPGRDHWLIQAGISVRAPASAGLMLAVP